jgi:hypothetical protein
LLARALIPLPDHVNYGHAVANTKLKFAGGLIQIVVGSLECGISDRLPCSARTVDRGAHWRIEPGAAGIEMREDRSAHARAWYLSMGFFDVDFARLKFPLACRHFCTAPRARNAPAVLLLGKLKNVRGPRTFLFTQC